MKLIGKNNRGYNKRNYRKLYGAEQPLETNVKDAKKDDQVFIDQLDAIDNPINVGSLGSFDSVDIELDADEVDDLVEQVAEKLLDDSDFVGQVSEFAARRLRRKFNEDEGECKDEEKEDQEQEDVTEEPSEGEENFSDDDENEVDATEDEVVVEPTEEDEVAEDEDDEVAEDEEDEEEDDKKEMSKRNRKKSNFSSGVRGVQEFKAAQLNKMQNFTKHIVTRK